jgi:hypothetical protein
VQLPTQWRLADPARISFSRTLTLIAIAFLELALSKQSERVHQQTKVNAQILTLPTTNPRVNRLALWFKKVNTAFLRLTLEIVLNRNKYNQSINSLRHVQIPLT